MEHHGVIMEKGMYQLSGTLAAGDVYVIAADQADAAILAEADLAFRAYESPCSSHNGDDGIALLKDGSYY